MKFKVNRRCNYPTPGKNSLNLYENNWDDFGYKTTFNVYYDNDNGSRLDLGSIQVGFKGMDEGRVIDNIPLSFQSLPDTFFSLGISEEYYKNVSSLDKDVQENIYTSLNDMAYNLKIFDQNEKEKVVQVSLLRGRTAFSVRCQLNRISHGGAILTPYNFRYISPECSDKSLFSQISLTFDVSPDSNPPTNIHVLIGRNGTGKTRLLQNMIKSLQTDTNSFGSFVDLNETYETEMNLFANVLCVSFSPFDDYSSVLNNKCILPFSYIGLDKTSQDLLKAIQEQFITNFENCMASPVKKKRWLNTIQILKSDPAFDESKVQIFAKEWVQDSTLHKENAKNSIKKRFTLLSSGHKVILLIITACVDKLEEKSIVYWTSRRIICIPLFCLPL